MSQFDHLTQTPNSRDSAFAHTYSVIARDPETGEMAVGVQSHWFSVGTIVSWGRSGVGVIATQSFVNPEYGPRGLDLMYKGKSATVALKELVNKDPGKAYRQLAFMDNTGKAAAFTGEKCVESAMHHVGINFSVQANMMLNDNVIPAMKRAFQENEGLPVAERVLTVLKAGELAGGDIRGRQSAALLVVGPEKTENQWEDKKIDLRVDDHSKPLAELERLLHVANAYEFMRRGDVAADEKNIDLAIKHYNKAEEMLPDNLEMKYWKAVALTNSGKLKDALPIFKEIFKIDQNWRVLTNRLPIAGLLLVSPEELNLIVN